MQISKSFELKFAVDVVFAAWVSSKTVIAPATGMDVRAVVGGHYRLMMDHGSAQAEGIFSVVEPNQRLRYSWCWVGSDEVTQIDVRFVSAEDNTRIELRHTGFLTNESRDMQDTGWDSYIAGLRAFLRDRHT